MFFLRRLFYVFINIFSEAAEADDPSDVWKLSSVDSGFSGVDTGFSGVDLYPDFNILR